MFDSPRVYAWVSEPVIYRDADDLRVKLDAVVVPRAEARLRHTGGGAPTGAPDA